MIIFMWTFAIVLYAAIGCSIWDVRCTVRRRRHPHAMLITALAFLPLISGLFHGPLAAVLFYGGLIVPSIWANIPGLRLRTPPRRV
jgi:hypothetical protein